MAARHPVVTRLPLLVATARSVRWWGFGLTYEMSMVSPYFPRIREAPLVLPDECAV